MKNKKGLAQLGLVLGMLVLSVLIPITAKLVEKKQVRQEAEEKTDECVKTDEVAEKEDWPMINMKQLCGQIGCVTQREETLEVKPEEILRLSLSANKNTKRAKVRLRMKGGGEWGGGTGPVVIKPGEENWLEFKAPKNPGEYEVLAAGYDEGCWWSCSNQSYYTGGDCGDKTGLYCPMGHKNNCYNTPISIRVVREGKEASVCPKYQTGDEMVLKCTNGGLVSRVEIQGHDHHNDLEMRVEVWQGGEWKFYKRIEINTSKKYEEECKNEDNDQKYCYKDYSFFVDDVDTEKIRIKIGGEGDHAHLCAKIKSCKAPPASPTPTRVNPSVTPTSTLYPNPTPTEAVEGWKYELESKCENNQAYIRGQLKGSEEFPPAEWWPFWVTIEGPGVTHIVGYGEVPMYNSLIDSSTKVTGVFTRWTWKNSITLWEYNPSATGWDVWVVNRNVRIDPSRKSTYILRLRKDKNGSPDYNQPAYYETSVEAGDCLSSFPWSYKLSSECSADGSREYIKGEIVGDRGADLTNWYPFWVTIEGPGVGENGENEETVMYSSPFSKWEDLVKSHFWSWSPSEKISFWKKEAVGVGSDFEWKEKRYTVINPNIPAEYILRLRKTNSAGMPDMNKDAILETRVETGNCVVSPPKEMNCGETGEADGYQTTSLWNMGTNNGVFDIEFWGEFENPPPPPFFPNKDVRFSVLHNGQLIYDYRQLVTDQIRKIRMIPLKSSGAEKIRITLGPLPLEEVKVFLKVGCPYQLPTEIPTPTTTEIQPSPTATLPTNTPTATPAPRECNDPCNNTDAKCRAGLECKYVEDKDGVTRSHCRNPRCIDDDKNCDCTYMPPTPTRGAVPIIEERSCWDPCGGQYGCKAPWECKTGADGFSRCRNKDCVDENDCVCKLSPSPTPPTPTPTAQKQCNEQTASGGQGVDVKTYEMGVNKGQFKMRIETYDIPDLIEVRCVGGGLIYSTIQDDSDGIKDGFVSWQGRNITINFDCPGTRIEVKVTAPLDDTLWKYVVHCPDQLATMRQEKEESYWGWRKKAGEKCLFEWQCKKGLNCYGSVLKGDQRRCI